MDKIEIFTIHNIKNILTIMHNVPTDSCHVPKKCSSIASVKVLILVLLYHIQLMKLKILLQNKGW